MIEGRVPSGSVEIAFRDSATSGPDLVLSHGVFANLEYFASLASRLERTYRVVSYDLRGHGQSGSGPSTRSDHASDLVALIERLELARPLVIGVSYGAWVGLEVAHRRSPPLSGLVNIDGPLTDRADAQEFVAGTPTGEERREAVRAWVESQPDRHWSGSRGELEARMNTVSADERAFELRKYVEDGSDHVVQRPDPGTCAEMIISGYAPSQFLYEGLIIPTLVLVGTQSTAVFDSIDERAAAATRLAELHPEIEMQQIDGPHDLVRHNLDEVSTAITEWAQS